MKKLLGIFYILLFAIILTSCRDKYTTIYCDFDAGDFKSEGYYYLRSVEEVKNFKLEHNASAQMSTKLHYDDDFFKKKFAIVIILPETSADVSYKIESIEYKTSTLDIIIKKTEKNTTTKPDTNPGDGTNNSNGEGNNGSIMDKAEDIIDNIGDSNDNNGAGNTTPDNNQNETDKPTTPDNNQGDSTTPTNLVNKAFILEFRKTDTITKISLKIV